MIGGQKGKEKTPALGGELLKAVNIVYKSYKEKHFAIVTLNE